MKLSLGCTSRPLRVVIRKIIVAVLLGIVEVMNFVPAQAAPVRVSRGDAEAVLHAGGTGGAAIQNHRTVSGGSPADLEVRVTIRALPTPLYDGRHYCQDDWHVIAAAEISGGDKSFTMQDTKTEAN